MNLTVVILGAITYGSQIEETIVKSINTLWISLTVDILIVTHCIFVFPFMINPLNQEIEELFNIPHSNLPQK